MIIPQKHSVYHRGQRFNYLLFDSLGQFDHFVKSEIRRLNDHNAQVLRQVNAGTKAKIEAGSKWYGEPTPSNLDELDQHDSFLGMHLLKEIRPKIEQQLSEYLKFLDTEVMPKPKISYNDRGLGLFSFDRAAMGLYQTGKIALDSPIEKAASQINIELGRDRINTNIKKVYAYFEHKDRSYPSLRLYMMAGANASVEGKQLLYVGLACVELVDFLEARGVAVDVNVLIGTAFDDQKSMAVIRAKRFQDKVDKNRLLLLSSDPRYFRYKGFKSLIALSNHFGLNIPQGLGRIEESMGDDFIAALRYQDKKDSTKGFVFEQSYSMESAAQEVKRIIETYQTELAHGKKA